MTQPPHDGDGLVPFAERFAAMCDDRSISDEFFGSWVRSHGLHILSALRSQVRGWQPIETAPKDGTKVDVWTANGERWTNVWWERAKQDWLHWWGDSWGGMGAQRLDCRPTHWMPLPEPPDSMGEG